MPVPSVGQAVLYRALRLAQVTRGPGRTANPEQIQDALSGLNDLLDSLNIQREALYTTRFNSYTLSPPKPYYTIGQDPAGVLVADFNAPRPIRIDRARLVLMNSTPPTYLPLKLLSDAEWSLVAVRGVTSAVPTMVYCDYGYPLAKLYIWPIPTQANQIEIWDWQQLQEFATKDDPFVAPQGYQEMLVYQLAVRMADQFGTELRPNILATANKLLGRVKALNDPSTPIPSVDWGTSVPSGGGGTFNWVTGQPG